MLEALALPRARALSLTLSLTPLVLSLLPHPSHVAADFVFLHLLLDSVLLARDLERESARARVRAKVRETEILV